MIRVPRVRRPCRALSPCCLAVSLSTGVFGVLTALGSNCCVCQMKSCSKFPSFLLKSKFFACVTTSRTSVTSALPSVDSLPEGWDKALDARKLFRATSIWSFCWQVISLLISGLCDLIVDDCAYRRNLSCLESTDDAVDLELPINIRLLLLQVDGPVHC